MLVEEGEAAGDEVLLEGDEAGQHVEEVGGVVGGAPEAGGDGLAEVDPVVAEGAGHAVAVAALERERVLADGQVHLGQR